MRSIVFGVLLLASGSVVSAVSDCVYVGVNYGTEVYSCADRADAFGVLTQQGWEFKDEATYNPMYWTPRSWWLVESVYAAGELYGGAEWHVVGYGDCRLLGMTVSDWDSASQSCVQSCPAYGTIVRREAAESNFFAGVREMNDAYVTATIDGCYYELKYSPQNGDGLTKWDMVKYEAEPEVWYVQLAYSSLELHVGGDDTANLGPVRAGGESGALASFENSEILSESSETLGDGTTIENTTAVETSVANQGATVLASENYPLLVRTDGRVQTIRTDTRLETAPDLTSEEAVTTTTTDTQHPITSAVYDVLAKQWSVSTTVSSFSSDSETTTTGRDSEGNTIYIDTVKHYSITNTGTGDGTGSDGIDEQGLIDGIVSGIRNIWEEFVGKGEDQTAAIDAAGAPVIDGLSDTLAKVEGIADGTYDGGLNESVIPNEFEQMLVDLFPVGGECPELLVHESDLLGTFCEKWDEPNGGREIVGWVAYALTLIGIFYLFFARAEAR